jgi:hypothetical protein
VKLASLSERISNAGAEVIAISVDGDERTVAMSARWPTPHVLYVSDPGGERYLQPMDMFDPNERDGIALPGLFVIDPDGNEVFGYRGNDFADRRNDEDLFAELAPLGLVPFAPPAGGPNALPNGDAPEEQQKGAFMPKLFGPFFSGNKFGAIALGMRAEGDEAKTLAGEHRDMAQSMLDAWTSLNS